jgi:DNA-binding NtrC family response regulator
MNRADIKRRFNIIGDSPKLNAALDIAAQVAPTEVTVLVVGENGSGKDVFSHIIYQLSARKHKPFIAINCGAIPEGTIDSELFGHEKGSFTSAYESRKGYFEEVNGGMIFMDEIAEMPLYTQSRLLRVLENGEFLRVGSSKVQKTDVRIIAATNKNLVEQIRLGKFREDLYFRLNTVTIYVPALRERGNDIELLFRFFAAEFGQRYGREAIVLSEDARQMLYDYHWPGNVRELKNFVEKLTVLVREPVVTGTTMQEHLPVRESRLPVLLPNAPRMEEAPRANGNHADNEFLMKVLVDLKSEISDIKRALYGLSQQGAEPRLPNLGGMPPDRKGTVYPEVVYPLDGSGRLAQPIATDVQPVEAPPLEESLSLERKERDLIAKALAKFGHNRKKAAQELGISERTLYRKIKSYDLDK